MNAMNADDLSQFLSSLTKQVDEDTAEGRVEGLSKWVDINDDKAFNEFKNHYLGESSQHEAKDRVFIATQTFDNYILEHPFILLNPKLYDLAFKISIMMGTLYQDCNQEEYLKNKDDDDAKRAEIAADFEAKVSDADLESLRQEEEPME